MSEKLEDLRRKIDALDAQIVDLLNARAEVVVKIGKIKQSDDTPIYAPDREKMVFDRILAANRGKILPNKTLIAIYRELMSGSFSLERPQRIAYLGPEGSHSHLAATEQFGASVEYEAVNHIRGVFEEVTRGHADMGIVPIENSIGGGVIDTLDALLETDVSIFAEIVRAIHHNLLARCGIDELEKLYSKPEVFAQCQRWLADTGLTGKTIPVASTSRAAELARDEDRAGALGSSLAAKLYELNVVCPNIEDNPNNVTRFFVVGKKQPGPTGDDKTSLLFTTSDKPGALADVLDAFRQNGINLSFIESRPSKKRNWEYYFFADARGHRDDENVKRAMGAAREHCLQLNILGSFPRATEAP